MHLTLNGEAGFLPPPGLREFCGLGQRVFFAVFPVGPSEGLIYLTKVASEGFLTPRQGGAIPGLGNLTVMCYICRILRIGRM